MKPTPRVKPRAAPRPPPMPDRPLISPDTIGAVTQMGRVARDAAAMLAAGPVGETMRRAHERSIGFAVEGMLRALEDAARTSHVDRAVAWADVERDFRKAYTDRGRELERKVLARELSSMGYQLRSMESTVKFLQQRHEAAQNEADGLRARLRELRQRARNLCVEDKLFSRASLDSDTPELAEPEATEE